MVILKDLTFALAALLAARRPASTSNMSLMATVVTNVSVEVAAEAPAGTAWLVLDASAVAQVDSTAAAMLRQLRTMLAEKGLTLALAELHKEPREILQLAGLFDGPEATPSFDDVEDAVRALSERRS